MPMLTPKQALDRIHTLMDGTEWDADTTSAIAETLVAAGYDVHEPNDNQLSTSENME